MNADKHGKAKTGIADVRRNHTRTTSANFSSKSATRGSRADEGVRPTFTKPKPIQKPLFLLIRVYPCSSVANCFLVVRAFLGLSGIGRQLRGGVRLSGRRCRR